MIVVGIDLAGPANAANTALVAFRVRGDRLQLEQAVAEADDRLILDRFRQWTARDEVVAGLDAPLSYHVGGGDRPGDARLRQALVAVGLRPGTVMTPTFNRMVYLTLRGIAVARLLQTLSPRSPSLVEVHPAGTMALRGGPVERIRTFKDDAEARRELLDWLAGQGLEGVAAGRAASDHDVAACASALAAWQWSLGQEAWVERADPPLHPFDFAC